MTRKILQIIPASDWFAEYQAKDGNLISPLVCWALCEDEGHIVVYPMDASIGDKGEVDFSDEAGNFIKVFHKL